MRVSAVVPPALDTEAAENDMTDSIKHVLMAVSVGSGLHSSYVPSYTRHVLWPTVVADGCEVK